MARSAASDRRAETGDLANGEDATIGAMFKLAGRSPVFDRPGVICARREKLAVTERAAPYPHNLGVAAPNPQ